MRRRPPAVATIAHAAAITFEARPLAAAALGDRTDWMERSAESYPTLALAFGVFKFDDSELAAAIARTDIEAWAELLDCARAQQEFYAALAKMLRTAQARLLIALSRHAVREGVA